MEPPTWHDIFPDEQVPSHLMEANKLGKRKRQENDALDIQKFRRVRIVNSSGFARLDPKGKRVVCVSDPLYY